LPGRSLESRIEPRAFADTASDTEFGHAFRLARRHALLHGVAVLAGGQTIDAATTLEQTSGMTAAASHPPLNPLLKLALELGPLGIFFLANARPALFAPSLALVVPEGLLSGERAGIFAATAVFMAATLLALAMHYWLVRKLPIMPLVSGAVVLVFGTLTIALHDEFFIKLKPTIVNMLFGTVLVGGLLFGKSLLSLVLDSVFQLTAEGWRKLTLRWGLFFFFLAALNEIVWRTQSTDFWVSFKVFGIMPITLLFALSQTPLLMRHGLSEADAAAEAPATLNATDRSAKS
jgi:intracellular septation protein